MRSVVDGQEYESCPFLLFALVPQGNTPLVEQGVTLSLNLSLFLNLSLSRSLPLSIITKANAQSKEDKLVRDDSKLLFFVYTYTNLKIMHAQTQI